MAVPSSGSGAVVVRCRGRAGSWESMVAGACGGCNGCGRMGHGKAAYPCTQSMPQGTPACRIGTGPQRTGSLKSLLCARMAKAKKSLCPLWGHRQEKQAGEGGVFGGSPLASTAEMRPDGGRRPCPLRRRKLRASTAEMRPNGGRRPCPLRRRKLRASTAEMRPNGGRRPCPLARKTPHGITGNEEGP